MNKVKEKKLYNVIVTVLVLLEVIFVHLTFKSLENKPTELYDVKLRDEIKEDNNSFALMIEQEDGSYSTTLSDTWPTDKTFNKELSGCLDTNGIKIKDSINFDYVNKTAIITAGETTYCYLYFDIDKTFAIYSETDNSLRFYNNDDYNTIMAGETYNELVVTAKYNGVENTNYQQSGETINTPWFEYANEITSVYVENAVSPNNTKLWFNRLRNVTYLDLTYLNTINVSDMYGMFSYVGYNVNDFKIDGLSNWDTSNVINMSYIFQGAGYSANNIEIGDINNWDTSKVLQMQGMFHLTGYNVDTFKINISNWDVSSVTNMYQMFHYAGYSAPEFDIGDLSNWNTSNVTNMKYMFRAAGYNATEFNIGDIGKWNVSKVTNMSELFHVAGFNATTFIIGDLSNWNTSNVTTTAFMFANSGRDSTNWNIGDISKWNMSKVTTMESMFHSAGIINTDLVLDLSGWQVPLVTNYTNFDLYVENKILEPTWVN